MAPVTEPFDAEAYVSAAAPAVGLMLTPSERRDVAVHLARIHGFACLALELELGIEDELAPRFEP